MVATSASGRPMRRDARENRERILDAAQVAFDEHGIEVPILRIIEMTGFGNGTFYRHFADHDALVLALYQRYSDGLATMGPKVAAAQTAWDAVLIFIDHTAESLLAHPSTADVLRRARELGAVDDRAEEYRGAMRDIVARAQDEGRLRPDLAATDLATMPYLISSWARLYTPEQRRALYPRIRALLLSALTNLDDDPLPGEAAGAQDFTDAVHQRAADL